jgi:hypothetical protein
MSDMAKSQRSYMSSAKILSPASKLNTAPVFRSGEDPWPKNDLMLVVGPQLPAGF